MEVHKNSAIVELINIRGNIVHFNSIQGILFDLDGTLISTLDLHVESFKWILGKLGKTVENSELEHLMGLTPQDIIKRFLTDLDPDSLWEAAKEKEEYLKTLIQEVHPYEGVVELLQSLKDNQIKTCVISSTHRGLVKILLERAGILTYLDHIVSGDEILHGKPHPEPFLLGLSKLGLENTNCLGIGDSIYDAESCVRADIRFVGVLTGKTQVDKFDKFDSIEIIPNMKGLQVNQQS